MIFSVQRFLEDYFERRGLADVDQYAVRIANLFARPGAETAQDKFAHDLARVRTVFYRRNTQLARRDFEGQIVAVLCSRFKKKLNGSAVGCFDGALEAARGRLRRKRRSIEALLSEFKRAVESRAIDAFWESRKRHALRPGPEKIAQALLAVFAKGTLGDDGLVLREIVSGIGFVDIGISFGGVLHLIELKIFESGRIEGGEQLATYMRTEQRPRGWLVIVDGRKDSSGSAVPHTIATSSGLITTIVVDINPMAPHTA